MAYQLQTEIGQAIYRLRKCTIEPVIGIIKEVLGFRQFSLRGLEAAAGEWCLVCLAFNLKRMHTLFQDGNLLWQGLISTRLSSAKERSDQLETHPFALVVPQSTSIWTWHSSFYC
jgi:hypothetical protein